MTDQSGHKCKTHPILLGSVKVLYKGGSKSYIYSGISEFLIVEASNKLSLLEGL